MLPETLDFEDNYESTVSHFSMLRRYSRSSRSLKSLKFDNIRFISPSAALVLASEVDRWNHMRGVRLRADIGSWHEHIQHLLQQMGYFELLHISAPPASQPPEFTTFLQFKRGDVATGNNGKLAKQLRIEIEALVGIRIKKAFLFEGLSEAITNVGQHAYPKDSFGAKQWWLSGSYDKQARRLCVMFYDQGVGIPATLPSSGFLERLREFQESWPDSQKIEAAMEVGRSSTGFAERGKGLQNLIEFAKAHDEGRLSIYSSRGLYRLNVSGTEPHQAVETLTKDFVNTMNGTLIEWSVKL